MMLTCELHEQLYGPDVSDDPQVSQGRPPRVFALQLGSLRLERVALDRIYRLHSQTSNRKFFLVDGSVRLLPVSSRCWFPASAAGPRSVEIARSLNRTISGGNRPPAPSARVNRSARALLVDCASCRILRDGPPSAAHHFAGRSSGRAHDESRPHGQRLELHLVLSIYVTVRHARSGPGPAAFWWAVHRRPRELRFRPLGVDGTGTRRGLCRSGHGRRRGGGTTGGSVGLQADGVARGQADRGIGDGVAARGEDFDDEFDGFGRYAWGRSGGSRPCNDHDDGAPQGAEGPAAGYGLLQLDLFAGPARAACLDGGVVRSIRRNAG